MVIPGLSIGAFITSYPLWVTPWIGQFHVERSTAVAGFTIGILIMALALPLVGAWTARFSARMCMTVGCALLAAGFFLSAAATSFWQILVLYATVLAGGAALTSVLPAQTVGVSIMPHKAGTVSGTVQLGASAGAMVVPALLTLPLVAYGWRPVFLIMGALAVLAIAPTAWLLPKNHSAAHGTASPAETPNVPASGKWSVFGELAFWVALICVVPGYFAVGAVQANAVAVAADSGIHLRTAEFLVPIIPAGAIVGSQVLGWLCDRVDYRWIFGVVATMIAVALLMLTQRLGPLPMAVAFAMLGVIVGGAVPIAGVIVVRNFEARAFPRVMGLILLPMFGGMAIGPMIMAWVRETTGTYSIGCDYLAALMLVSAIAVVLLRVEPKNLAGQNAPPH